MPHWRKWKVKQRSAHYGEDVDKKGEQVWQTVESVLEIARELLLHGPPGTGKSHAGNSQAGLNGRKLFSITLTWDMPAAELRGHLWPVSGEKGTEFVWKDGPAISAWRCGGRLVINELQKAGPDMVAFLLGCLDNPETARMTLPTGETVRPHPQFQVVGTMNGSPDELDSALRDRFPACIEITAPHPAGIARLPYDLQAAARGSVCAAEEDRRLSLRSWLAFADYREKLGEETAAFVVFGARAQDIINSLKIAR